MASTRPSLWRHRDFRHVWAGDTISVFGMELVSLAVPIMAVQLLGASELEMGLLTGLQMLAFLLIGLPSGAWVDRWRKKRVLILGDLSRAAVLLTLPAAWLFDVLTLPHVYVVAFVTGCLTVFFDVANQSYLPAIVPTEKIGEGNAKLQASQQTAAVVGPALGASLVRALGAPLAISGTSICMALSAFFVSRVRHVEQRPDPAARQPLRVEIGEGLSFVVRHPLLVRITACTGLANFTSTMVQALLVLYILRDLGLSETTLGLVLSTGGVGGVLGALSADRLARLVGEGTIIPVSAIVMPLAGTAMPLASALPSTPTLIAGYAIFSFAVVVYNVTQVSFRQRLCPPHLLGRMNASIRFLVWGPMPLGAFAGGALGAAIGVLPTLWFSVAGFALACVPVVLSPLLGMRELPTTLDALQGEADR